VRARGPQMRASVRQREPWTPEPSDSTDRRATRVAALARPHSPTSQRRRDKRRCSEAKRETSCKGRQNSRAPPTAGGAAKPLRVDSDQEIADGEVEWCRGRRLPPRRDVSPRTTMGGWPERLWGAPDFNRLLRDRRGGALEDRGSRFRGNSSDLAAAFGPERRMVRRAFTMTRAIAIHLHGRMPADARGTAQSSGLERDE
jgi:hypothetical protein